MDSLDHINQKTKQSYNLAAEVYFEFFHDELKEKDYDRRLLDSFSGRFDSKALILDAGCGPSAHIGRYVSYNGLQVLGVDISEKCVALARRFNPHMKFVCGDIGKLGIKEYLFDGIISYYSLIDTPKRYIDLIFSEFSRILKPHGYLIVAVKAGSTEGYMKELLGIKTDIYFTLFEEEELSAYFEQAGFILEFLEKRDPYDFEISSQRIFGIGKKA